MRLLRLKLRSWEVAEVAGVQAKKVGVKSKKMTLPTSSWDVYGIIPYLFTHPTNAIISWIISWTISWHIIPYNIEKR